MRREEINKSHTLTYQCRAEWVLGSHLNGSLALLLWLCGGTMIGAGVLCPFRRTITAWIGLAVQALLAVLVDFLSALAISGG